jgi:hypothetical protein
MAPRLINSQRSPRCRKTSTFTTNAGRPRAVKDAAGLDVMPQHCSDNQLSQPTPSWSLSRSNGSGGRTLIGPST